MTVDTLTNQHNYESRAFGKIEKIHKDIYDHGLGSSMVSFIAHLLGDVKKDLFLQAAHMIFQRHPLLRAVIREDTNNAYFDIRASFADVPIVFVNGNDDLAWKKIAEQDVSILFDCGKYLWRMQLVQQTKRPQESVLIFTGYHAILDGTSGSYLISQLLSYYESLYQQKKVSVSSLPLLPSVEEVADIHLIKEFGNQHTIFNQAAETIEFSAFEENIPMQDRTVGAIFKEYDENFLCTLKKQCRKENTTVNAALSAALLLAMQKKYKKKKSIQMTTPINVRKFCNPNVHNQNLVCYTGLSINLFFGLNQIRSFWDLARSFNAQMRSRFACSKDKTLGFDGVFVGPTEGYFTVDLIMTNLGYLEIPEVYGPLTLKSLNRLMNIKNAYAKIACHVASMNNKMFCTFGFCKPATSEAFTHSFIEIFTQILNKHIG